MPTYHDHIVDRYLKGGAFHVETLTLFTSAHSMIQKARVVQNIDDILQLRELFDRLFKEKGIEPTEIDVLHKLISNNYEYVTDDVLMISAFELYAKGKLLAENFVPHVIDKPNCLSKKQKKRPVHVSDLKAAQRRGDDVCMLYKTLMCRTLLKPKYIAIIAIQGEHVEEIKKMNKRRNFIHFREPSAYDIKIPYLRACEYLSSTIEARLNNIAQSNSMPASLPT